MPRYIISLGSNLPSGTVEVEAAMNWLAVNSSIISTTPTYTTPDIHDPSRPSYTNAIAIIYSDINEEEFIKTLKDYEISRGRTHGSADIPIDMDLVCRDNEILRPRDYNAPYFTKGLYLLSSAGRLSEYGSPAFDSSLA